MVSVDQLKKWFHDHREQILEDFFTFLRFQSISTDPQFNEECRETADWLKNYLKKIGFSVELWETPGLPVVFASYQAGIDCPTLLIYHHYDVQPVDPLELWKSPPFEPAIRDNQVYARGAQDNKGQCFYSITAMKAVMELAGSLDINLKIFIEGEEESGGRGTAAILEDRAKELQADYLIIVDFGIPKVSTPAITLGMRGLVALNVECSNSSIDLHSGVHGGIALNPNRALAQLLGSMWDETGKVTIPHFYDDVQQLHAAEKELMDFSFDRQEYEQTFGVHAFCNEAGYSLQESNWIRPTLEINGMSGGYTGSGFKTVIPAKAYAKISCRLVPHQHPDKIGNAIASYLKSKAPVGIHVEVEVHHGAPAFRSRFDSVIVKTAALVYKEIFERPCKYLMCGASVPIVVDLARVSQAEVAMIGLGLAEDDIHAPNEHFGLDRFELGVLMIGRLVTSFGG